MSAEQEPRCLDCQSPIEGGQKRCGPCNQERRRETWREAKHRMTYYLNLPPEARAEQEGRRTFAVERRRLPETRIEKNRRLHAVMLERREAERAARPDRPKPCRRASAPATANFPAVAAICSAGSSRHHPLTPKVGGRRAMDAFRSSDTSGRLIVA